MKKLLLGLLLGLGFVLAPKTLTLRAEAVESELPSEEVSVEEVVESEEISQVEETSEIDESEYTLDEFKAEIEQKLNDYVEQDLASKIISWLIESGLLCALFVVYVKYRKHKAMTLEDVAKLAVSAVKEELKKQFGELSKEEIKKITSKVGELEQSVETVMKVLVLMQDNTPKGKAALIEFLGSKTNSQEVKNATEQVEASLKQEEQAKQEVNNKVSGEYKDIF